MVESGRERTGAVVRDEGRDSARGGDIAVTSQSLPALCARSVGESMAEEGGARRGNRSEEHTSELQSPCNLVCRLLLEKINDELCTVWATYTAARRSRSARTLRARAGRRCRDVSFFLGGGDFRWRGGNFFFFLIVPAPPELPPLPHPAPLQI